MPTLAATAVHHLAHQPDEDFINKSLLDSLDAQADAEPISSGDDSDHPVATSFGSTSNSSSSGSPSVNFPAAHHHHIVRSDSPGDTTPHNYLSLHSQELFMHQAGLYTGNNHVNTLHMHPDFSDEYDHPKFHPQQQLPNKLNGFSNSNYRAFNSFPNTTRSRHQANQSVLNPPTTYRDTATFYPTQNPDAFPTQMTSPVQSHMQPYDSRVSFDYPNGQPNGTHKSYLADQYGGPNNNTLHNVGKPISQQQPNQQPLTAYGATQYSNGVQLSSQTPYGPHVLTNVAMGAPSNSSEISTIFVVGFPEDMQEREFQNMFTFSPGFEAATLKIPNKEYTAYGGLVGATAGATLANGVNGLRGPGFQTYGGSNDPYNIVTVNQGGVVVDGGRDGTMASWPAANPLVNEDLTQNQHFLSSGPLGIGGLPGVGVGAATGANLPPRKQIIGFAKFRTRDEALVARDVLQGRRVDIEKGAVLKAEMAKKNLHTKRGVGPIPGVSAAGAAAAAAAAAANPLQAQNSTSSTPRNGIGLDSFPSREHRDSTSLQGFSRMGWRDSAGQEQQPQPNAEAHTLANLTNGNGSARDEEERKRDSDGLTTSLGGLSLSGPPSLSPIATGPGAIMMQRGARERAEEEEWERRRKEKEMNLMRLRARDSATFDAFHGVPSVNGAPAAATPTSSSTSGAPASIPISRQSSNASANPPPSSASNASTNSGTGGLLTPSSTAPTTAPAESVAGSSPMISSAEAQPQQQEVVGPWDRVNTSLPVGSGSQRSNSPPAAIQEASQRKAESESSQTSAIGNGSASGNVNPLGPIGAGSGGSSNAANSEISATVRTSSGELVLNNLSSVNSTHHLHHHLQQLQQQQAHPQQPSLAGTIGTSFAAGAGASGVIANAGGPGSASSGSNGNGNTSPTLPSPASGGSSGSVSTTSTTGMRGTVDQNPPINTLYVGNLPTSPPPIGYPHDYLEETLREVFSVRPGYRKLCFRQKAAGPMCFVEFEDVHYASRAMTEMSGNTLRGAVKNGIRLSYSKNPLGFEDVHYASRAMTEMSGNTLRGAVKNGIRLSYSKNPLGVRTPTSAGSGNGGPTLQQQQQLMQTLSNHHYAHAFQHVFIVIQHPIHPNQHINATSTHIFCKSSPHSLILLARIYAQRPRTALNPAIYPMYYSLHFVILASVSAPTSAAHAHAHPFPFSQ
ncbi:unnamed protein product [Cyclocybe aegerita]|uniref:RRM domain-containing protein n=1 Tax=Cyclocybe aegerita TaxID=1973307 RepID=A0A8S0VVZ6_CYCAE|nr:unnamed protein product [Cyclocybe aegerita]